jgi:hypothetical protein
MGMLEPIERTRMDEAQALLARGFPMRSPAFWASGLDRLMAHHDAEGLGPVGQILKVKGEAAGIMLTIRSRRADGGTVINLSSWYVEPRYRLLGPKMLTRVLEEPADRFTDLTPSPVVTDMIGRFGFVQRHAGALLVALPVAALSPASGVRIIDGAPDGGDASLLAGHRDLGCLVLRVVSGEGEAPLVVSVAQRRGLPVARLVYAKDLAAVRAAIGPLARYLLARGLPLLEMPANPGDRVPGGWFTQRARPTFLRGAPPAAEVDHAYSEFVFLRI